MHLSMCCNKCSLIDMDETGTEQEQSLKGEEWPQSFKDLAGAWKDLPTAEEIRKASDEASLLMFEDWF